MKSRICFHFSLAAISFLAFSFSLLPSAAQSRPISKTEQVAGYSVTLKVLPAEAFTGPKAEMVRLGGAQPDLLGAPVPPNHHMIALVAEDGKPVENAKVRISYRRLSPETGAWTTLPVVRMDVAGKGLTTTHYGNNVKLDPGSYEARVSVDGKGPATFRFSLAE